MNVPADLVFPAADQEEFSAVLALDGRCVATYPRQDFPVDVLRLQGSASPPIVLPRLQRAEALTALPASLRSRAEMAFERAARTPRALALAHGRSLDLSQGPVVMGVVNVTPDSFSDGGLYFDADRARDRAMAMLAGGAAIVDVGGESTRPVTYGESRPVSPDEEVDRVVPVIEAIRRETDSPISVDTRRAAVAIAAIAAGADLVNDVSALRHDPEMAGVVGTTGAGLILMHMKGDDPRTMQDDVVYRHPIADIAESLAEFAARALAHGVRAEAIAVDPGLGFGKSLEGNLLLIRHLAAFRSLGFPLAVGASRKGFVRRFSGISDTSSAAERLPGSLAAAAAAVAAGALLLRVHDAEETVRFLRMARAIRTARAGAPEGAAAR